MHNRNEQIELGTRSDLFAIYIKYALTFSYVATEFSYFVHHLSKQNARYYANDARYTLTELEDWKAVRPSFVYCVAKVKGKRDRVEGKV